eukprot:886258-Pleurochrysis_carterae.AAC.3
MQISGAVGQWPGASFVHHAHANAVVAVSIRAHSPAGHVYTPGHAYTLKLFPVTEHAFSKSKSRTIRLIVSKYGQRNPSSSHGFRLSPLPSDMTSSGAAGAACRARRVTAAPALALLHPAALDAAGDGDERVGCQARTFHLIPHCREI